MRKPTEKIATVLRKAATGCPFSKKLDRQDRGEAAEDVEVVPLDDVADGCGDDDTAELFERDLGSSSHGPPLVYDNACYSSCLDVRAFALRHAAGLNCGTTYRISVQ